MSAIIASWEEEEGRVSIDNSKHKTNFAAFSIFNEEYHFSMKTVGSCSYPTIVLARTIGTVFDQQKNGLKKQGKPRNTSKSEQIFISIWKSDAEMFLPGTIYSKLVIYPTF